MPNSDKNNIMITGCAGFIGSHATDYFLKNGHYVVGIDCFTYAASHANIQKAGESPNFKIINENICNTQSILKICKNYNIGWIFNFAAETHVDNSINSANKFVESNISGVRSLLDVCKELKIKLFHVSTDEVYGSILEGSSLESDKLDPRNPYSATKAAAEHLITSYNNTYDIEYIMVRPSNNFGPRQHREKFLPTIISSLITGNKIPVYGDGQQIRDWLYVKDNVRVIYDIWKRSSLNKVYNISFNNEKQNIEVVTKVLEIMGKNFNNSVEFVEDRPGHDFRYSVSPLEIKKLGVDMKFDFDRNLRETVNWYLESKR